MDKRVQWLFWKATLLAAGRALTWIRKWLKSHYANAENKYTSNTILTMNTSVMKIDNNGCDAKPSKGCRFGSGNTKLVLVKWRNRRHMLPMRQWCKERCDNIHSNWSTLK